MYIWCSWLVLWYDMWYVTKRPHIKGWFKWTKRNALRLPWDKHKLQRMTGELPLGNYGVYLSVLGLRGGTYIRFYRENGSIKDVKRFYWFKMKLGY